MTEAQEANMALLGTVYIVASSKSHDSDIPEGLLLLLLLL